MKFSPHIPKVFGGAGLSRHEPEGVRVVSDIYWRAVLALGALAALGSLGYGVCGLLGILDELNSVVHVSAPPKPALDLRVLDGTIRGFEDRRTQFELLKTHPGESIPDPSS